MIFDYPTYAHIRKHYPKYDNFKSYKDWLRDEFSFRCVYCLSRETWALSNGDADFGVDHFIAKSVDQSIINSYENLYYSCNRCNSIKSVIDFKYDVCTYIYSQHLVINKDGTIKYLTDIGEHIVNNLRLDDDEMSRFRAKMIRLFDILLDKEKELIRWFGYPDNLPDLSLKRCENIRSNGIQNSFFELRKKGQLPKTY